MFEKTGSYDAWFLPGPDAMPPDDAMRDGLRWLVYQPGSPLVALHAKKMVGNNQVLRQAAASGRFEVVAPPRMWLPGWAGGAVLAPWASRLVLDGIDDDLGGRVSAVCVIGWVDGAHDEWKAAHGARDLRDPDASHAAGPALDPVVVAAMTEVSRAVNHNNALVQTEDKAYAVIALQRLVQAGYRYHVSELCAWAAGNGFTAVEVKNLRDYATRVLQGRSFRLNSTYGPNEASVERWRAAADA